MGEHDCIQEERIKRNSVVSDRMLEAVGSLTAELKMTRSQLSTQIEAMDKRINGQLKDAKEHIAESVPYRRMVDEHTLALKNYTEEKNNTTKKSQWRIGLIVGTLVSTASVAANVAVKIFLK